QEDQLLAGGAIEHGADHERAAEGELDGLLDGVAGEVETAVVELDELGARGHEVPVATGAQEFVCGGIARAGGGHQALAAAGTGVAGEDRVEGGPGLLADAARRKVED